MPEKLSTNGRCVCPHLCSKDGRRAGMSFLGRLTWSLKSFVPEFVLLTGRYKVLSFLSLC